MIIVPPSELNPSQVLWVASRQPYSMLCAGVGSGKSTAGIVKILLLASTNPGRKGLVIAQTYGALFSNIVNPLREMCKRNLPRRLRPKMVNVGPDKDGPYLRFNNGSKVYLRSAENPKSYDGLTVAWLYGDELKDWTFNAYRVAIERVRDKQAVWPQLCFTTTPKFNWMVDEWRGRDDREVLQCSTYENLRNLPTDYIDKLKSTYSSRLIDAMLHGEWVVLEGAVFENFRCADNSQWITDWTPSRRDIDQCKAYLAVDPGYRRSAYIWIIERSPLDWVAHHQMMPDDKRDDDCVRMVNERGYPIDEIWIDTAAKAVQSQTGFSTLRSMQKIRTRVRDRSALRLLTAFARDIPFGIERLRVLLGGYDDGTPEGAPIRLHFTREIYNAERTQKRGIMKDLAASAYPEQSGKPVEDVPIKDGKVDHSRDAARYWATGMWMTVPVLRSTLELKGAGYTVAAAGS